MVRPQINTGRYVVLLATLALIGAARFTGPWAVALTTSVISVVLMLSLVVLVGYIGQLSLAQLAIAGISAFALMRFMSSSKVMNNSPVVVSGPGLPFIVAAPLAVATGNSMACGPRCGIRGVQLAIASIALALTIQEFVLEARDHRWRGRGPSQRPVPGRKCSDWTSGARSSDRSHRSVHLRGFHDRSRLDLDTAGRSTPRERHGTSSFSVRANERSPAAAVGVNVARTKIAAIALASAIAAVAGVMLALQRGALERQPIRILFRLIILAFAYIGGITSVWGAVIGGLSVAGGLLDYFIRDHVPSYIKYGAVVGGLLLTLNVVLNPANTPESFRVMRIGLKNRIAVDRSPTETMPKIVASVESRASADEAPTASQNYHERAPS